MKKIFVLVFLISMVTILTIIGLRSSKNSIQEGKTSIIIKTLGSTRKEIFDANGESVIELLERNHQVKINSNRLDCIDSVCTNKDFWWQFYVNNDLVLSSVQSYIPREGDIIRLEYGDIR